MHCNPHLSVLFLLRPGRDDCAILIYLQIEQNSINHSWYAMNPLSKVRCRNGQRRGKERENIWRGGWENMNKHMASIDCSLLHHQICIILIRTLGFFFCPFFFHHVSLQWRTVLRRNNTNIKATILSFYQTDPVKMRAIEWLPFPLVPATVLLSSSRHLAQE